MVRSMFSGVAGLRAHQTKMDVIGNNIANVNTYGFKSGRVTFRDVYYQTLTAASSPGALYGGSNPSQIGYGTAVGSIDVLHTRSGFAPTDNPMDVMIDGEGYFITGQRGLNTSWNGNLEPFDFTRVGIFNFDANGNLVDSNSNFVYGFSSKRDANDQPIIGAGAGFESTLEPIRIPINSVTGEPIKLTSISIGADGTITGIDENNNIISVAKVAVANIPNASSLTMSGNSYFKAIANTGVITGHVPGEGTTGRLQSGGLEMSNVDLSKEFTEMITTQRGYQANSRIITVTDTMLEELVNLKR